MKVFWHKTSSEISLFFGNGECTIIPESHKLFNEINNLCDNNNPENENSRMQRLIDILIDHRSESSKTIVEDLLGVSRQNE